MKFYMIGSLRNKHMTKLAKFLRETYPDHEFWMDWYSAGYEADDKWQEHAEAKGLNFIQALDGDDAHHVWSFDKHHLDSSQAAILVLPAGKSGHLELGYMVGKDKPTIVCFNRAPERWDVMYRFVDFVVHEAQGLTDAIDNVIAQCVYDHTPGANNVPDKIDQWTEKSYGRS